MEETTAFLTWEPGMIWPMAAILFLLVCSAFFSGSETALTAANRAKLHGQGTPGATRALTLKEDSERLIGGILLGNNLANILATSLATALLTVMFGENGVAVATLVMTLLVLIFAEVLPKTYAIINPERMAALVSLPIGLVVRVLAPVVNVVRLIVRVTLRIFGVQTDPEASIMAHEEIAEAITLHASEGSVEKDDRDRLLAALDLKMRTVEEVMIHRRNIEMIDADSAPEDILTACLRSPHTRIPVYRDEPENIVGVIHAKDLLRAVDKLVRGTSGGLDNLSEFDVMDVAMEPWFVPDATTLDDQMRAFLRRHSHFALVVDEYGALQGLVTLEDILEEIVGDITDETDVEVDGLERLADGTYLVDGTMTIRDLNRATDWALPDDEANTIAGLIIHEAQTIPTTGQVFSFYGYRFEIAERARNQLTKLRIRSLL
ncbi:HlyC/CorC family transporter [Pontivivens insulae]|uniref:Magnesium and cobalt efflux protein CorC n=1 Tax=Pontivivens insulae TaxID=1639689 RepID=A0A2R8AB94_9RHOB|nr:HlyC/CorC family transporter [Pontivivens insulae]RED11344.1 Mg2+/Co2+ transporter CorB [Pontivivens insulae]SPF29483.1 Magnesium and cobalt efflux protein CorC [Pontivivens insulae]